MAGIYLSRWDKRTRDAQSIPVDREGRSRKREIDAHEFQFMFYEYGDHKGIPIA